MNGGVNNILALLSSALSECVAQAAPLLAAVRTGPSQHQSGILWRPGLLVTAEASLPPANEHAVVVPGGHVAGARPITRDVEIGVAVLQLHGFAAAAPAQPRSPLDVSVGSLALALAAAADASPTMRLVSVHRLLPADRSGVPSVVLDSPAGLLDNGGPVLDAQGGVIGMARALPDGTPGVVPFAVLAALAEGPPKSESRRGWLGLALQPVAVPHGFGPGAARGRLVVGVTPNGPAEQAGLRAGDILLAVDGQTINGRGALRALLGPETVGRAMELRLARSGRVETRQAVVTVQPEG